MHSNDFPLIATQKQRSISNSIYVYILFTVLVEIHRQKNPDEPYVHSNVVFTDNVATNMKACRAEMGTLLTKLGYEDGRISYTPMFLQTGYIKAITTFANEVRKKVIEMYVEVFLIRIRVEYEPSKCFAERLEHIGEPAAIAENAIDILNDIYAKQTHSHSYSNDHHRHAHAHAQTLH